MPSSVSQARPSPTQLQSWQIAALEQFPVAIVVFTAEDGIVFVNHACDELFQPEVVENGQDVLDLPIIWPIRVQHSILDISKHAPTSNRRRTEGALLNNAFHAVSISSSPSTKRSTADVRITTLQGEQGDVRMLTFENVKPVVPHSVNHVDGDEPKPKQRVSSTDGASANSSGRRSSDSNLEKQLARLREAIYYSNDDSGFMIDADETVVFPNWNGDVDVKPVKLKNGAADFLGWYDIWDTDFQVKLPLSAYPARRLNTERRKHRAYRIGLRVDGKDLITECSGDPLFDKDTGEYIGGVVWVRTLGERDQVVLADMKASLSDYQTICERLPHILWTMTPEGHVDYLTGNWYGYTGQPENEFPDAAFAHAIHPDDLDQFRESTMVSIDTKSNTFVEARVKRHDGTFLWFAIAAKPLLDDDNEKILKWYGTMTEIQSLVAERQEADRKKTQMQDMLTLADVSLFMLSQDRQLNMMQGRPFWQTKNHKSGSIHLGDIQPGGIPDFESSASEVLNGSIQQADFEFELQSRWYKCRLINNLDADADADTRGLLGCTIDITDQRQKSLLMIENSRLVTERAVALEKNRLKDEFLAHMSHEIRTPIAGVIGMTEVLQETELTAKQMETLKDITDSAKTLLDIVNDLLDLSKIDSGKMTFERVDINISDLVDQVSRVFQHSVRHKPVELRLAENVTPDLMMVGDPTKIRQIISNLLSNAIKFTSKGSVTLSVSIKSGEICLAVKDTGIGISDSTLGKLFSPFVQGDSSTARQYGGTGLGLVICRGLAEMMGGNLNIESVLGSGTTATLKLPQITFDTPIEDGVSPIDDKIRRDGYVTSFKDTTLQPTLRPNSDNPTILVVDDNAINRRFALHLIAKHGYHGASAFNGQDALDYLSSDPANIALILMDCQMPIMDGYETVTQIRNDAKFARWKDVPIVALTASAIAGDKEKCASVGMNEYLRKPVGFPRFQEVVGKWLPARSKEVLDAESRPQVK